jgi:hypothetical protein
VSNALQRNPELADSKSPLLSVTYASGGAPDGINDHQYEQMVSGQVERSAGATTSHWTDQFASDPEYQGERLVINDFVNYEDQTLAPPAVSAADGDVEGMITHELGHAYFQSHGVDSTGAATALLDGVHISLSDLGSVSNYAASNPQESLAELYGMKYADGGTHWGDIDPDIRSSFDLIEGQVNQLPVSTHSYLPTVGNVPVGYVPLRGSPMLERMNQAAKANIATNAWVDIAESDDAVDPPVVTLMQEAKYISGRIRSVLREAGGNPYHDELSEAERILKRIREVYNPDESRDEKGEWSSGGSVAAISPHLPSGKVVPLTGTGPRTGFVGREAEAQQNMIDCYNRSMAEDPEQCASDRQWYEQQHDVIAQREAALNDPNLTPEKYCGMVAATSPRTVWDTSGGKTPNLDSADKAVLIAQANPGVTSRADVTVYPGSGMMALQLDPALRCYNGVDPAEALTTPKVASFYNNLAAPGQTDDVTIDGHMAQLMMGNASGVASDLLGKSNQSYGWAADQVRAAAATVGIPAYQFQAATWSQWRRENP